MMLIGYGGSYGGGAGGYQGGYAGGAGGAGGYSGYNSGGNFGAQAGGYSSGGYGQDSAAAGGFPSYPSELQSFITLLLSLADTPQSQITPRLDTTLLAAQVPVVHQVVHTLAILVRYASSFLYPFNLLTLGNI